MTVGRSAPTRERRCETILITVVLLAGCGPTYPTDPIYSNSGKPFTSEPDVYVDWPKREQAVTTEREVDGVFVSASPTGAAGWTLRIANHTDGPVSVLWDESSLVTSNARSQGRLIRGETKRMNVANGQPPSPVPPAAEVVQIVFAEKLAEMEEYEAKRVGKHYPPKWGNTIIDEQKAYQAAIMGSRLHVTLDVGGTKKIWTGTVVSNVGASSPSGRAD
jgi:hypothetical protein